MNMIFVFCEKVMIPSNITTTYYTTTNITTTTSFVSV